MLIEFERVVGGDSEFAGLVASHPNGSVFEQSAPERAASRPSVQPNDETVVVCGSIGQKQHERQFPHLDFSFLGDILIKRCWNDPRVQSTRVRFDTRCKWDQRLQIYMKILRIARQTITNCISVGERDASENGPEENDPYSRHHDVVTSRVECSELVVSDCMDAVKLDGVAIP